MQKIKNSKHWDLQTTWTAAVWWYNRLWGLGTWDLGLGTWVGVKNSNSFKNQKAFGAEPPSYV